MGLFDDKVSQDDVNKVSDLRNPPEFESGFGSFGGGGSNDFSDLDSLFDDNSMSDLFGDDSGFGGDSFGGGGDSFGGSSNNGFGSGSFGNNNNTFGNSTFGQSNTGFGNNAFSSNSFGNGGFGQNGFGQNGGGLFGQPPQQQVEQKPDIMDTAIDASIQAAQGLGQILIDMGKSFKDRNADDFAFLSNLLIRSGVIIMPIGIAMSIVGAITKNNFLSFFGFGSQIILWGGITLGVGAVGMGTSALVLSKKGDKEIGGIDSISDEAPGEDNFTNELEDNSGDIMDDLFGSDFDDLFNDIDNELKEDETLNDIEETHEETEAIEIAPIDYNKVLEDVRENTYLSRQTLFNTFIGLLSPCTPNFSEVKKLSPDSKDWKDIDTVCLKALAIRGNVEFEDLVNVTHVESIEETIFAYFIKLKRIKQVKKAEDLAQELENFLGKHDDKKDISVTCVLSGDFYKIVISKGAENIVTFGDIFKIEKNKEFFLNTKNKIPVILGLSDTGEVILDDAKLFDTMLIAGKPRSGKSWYLFAILGSMMLFNTPEDVSFIMVDPKDTNLFQTMALMPHVIGLHNKANCDSIADRTISIFDELIEVEAPRRKKLLADNKCEDIWALRSKGIQLPIIYLVIDEFMTLIEDMDKEKRKTFDSKMRVLISQLPFIGIRLMFIPHRATGVVDKTSRQMLQFTAAVKSTNEDIIDTLDIKSWNRPLTKLGDIALRTSSRPEAMYVRSIPVARDDDENKQLLTTAASIFYKMGVQIPDNKHLKISHNINYENIKAQLSSGGDRVQFDANKLKDELNNIDSSDFTDF